MLEKPRFKILEGNRCAVYDSIAVKTYNLMSGVQAQDLRDLLNLLSGLLSDSNREIVTLSGRLDSIKAAKERTINDLEKVTK